MASTIEEQRATAARSDFEPVLDALAPRDVFARARTRAEAPATSGPESARDREGATGAIAAVIARAEDAGGLDAPGSAWLEDFALLISPAASAPALLERAARAAHRLAAERFGKTIQLYAPLYLSNECVSTCTYCGFSRENAVTRRTLDAREIAAEARLLVERGFRHLLLVTGEHPKAVAVGYLADAIRAARAAGATSVSIEVAPLAVDEYRTLTRAGADGLVVYQETYDRAAYASVHLGGKKRDFAYRLGAPERGADAGMRRLGVGALLGLADWRADAIALAAHARFLLRRAWRASLTVSVPRLRPAAGGFAPPRPVGDRDFVQLVVALRLALPDVGITLSTREAAAFRDRLIPLGVTQLSAGSRTEPGGYSEPRAAEPQFEIEDDRSADEVAAAIARLGYDPVWKDWEASLHG